jgi:hypothetical protein
MRRALLRYEDYVCLNGRNYIIQIFWLFVRFLISDKQVKRLPKLSTMGGDLSSQYSQVNNTAMKLRDVYGIE